ncbi:MAG: hypothetical protein JWM56_435 [Candidatus Peribacteria bacterium]|nr:hypothetical protein [Candidatus Peribacteria bacterium]
MPVTFVHTSIVDIQELVAIGTKTTMKIGGQARFFADIRTKQDLEEAYAFASGKNLPLIVLGAGSNTVFAEGVIEAVVIRIKADAKCQVSNTEYQYVEAGKYLAMLINELAAEGLDLSPLTGIPGTIGGAVFGNAGQGAKGIWMDHYIQEVEVFDSGEWKILSKEECEFRYRESFFKDHSQNSKLKIQDSPIIWSATLEIPAGEPEVIKKEIERLLQKRIETQPHVKTAGSCFKSLPDGTPAWQLIEKAGLRGLTIGGIQVAEKHANFLLNTGGGTFDDIVTMTKAIREKVPEIAGIEMRLYGADGTIVA